MAARRERERRRPPTEPRYAISTGDGASTTAAPDDANDALLGTPEAAAATAAVTAAAKRSVASRTPTSGRPSAKPFSAYRADYAYVASDLRRVAVVIGSLLAVLIVLHFLIAR